MEASVAKIEKSIAGAPFPTPVALVTTVDGSGKSNIITLAWVGIVCSNPFMVGVSIRPARHSHKLLLEVPEMVINVPTENILKQTDFCGTVSGRETKKFQATGLTAENATLVKAPLIAECPISLEGAVKERLTLGTHDLFICEIVASHVDEALLNEGGKVDFMRIKPIVYLATDYRGLGKKIGYYAFTKKEAQA